MSCNDCNSCNSCGTQIYWVCWLLEWNDIEIIDVTQVWTCCKTYEINSLVNIDSPDGSIDVTKTGNTFHIQQADPDTDKLVAVNSADTPWFLANKIVSTCNNILTITPTQIWINDRVLDICIDPAKINVPDVKVAADAWCANKYLKDILKTNHTDFFEYVKTGCDVSLQVDEQDRFLAHMYTTDSYDSWVLPTGTAWYGVIDTALWTSESTIPAQVATTPVVGVIVWSGWDTLAVTIPYNGWYTISFGWSGKSSQGVSTVRNQVIILRGWVEFKRIFDDRFSWSRVAEDNPADQIIQDAELNNLTGYLRDTDPPVWVELAQLSLTNCISSFWFWSSRTMQLLAWDKIYFVWKVSTVTMNNTDYPFWPQIAYLSPGLDTLTNGRWSGVFVCVSEELTKKINH
jgi:hypothetical protein